MKLILRLESLMRISVFEQQTQTETEKVEEVLGKRNSAANSGRQSNRKRDIKAVAKLDERS